MHSRRNYTKVPKDKYANDGLMNVLEYIIINHWTSHCDCLKEMNEWIDAKGTTAQKGLLVP